MIDRNKVEKGVKVLEALLELEIKTDLEIYTDHRDWRLWAWCPDGMPEDVRRKAIAIVTPLVGKTELSGNDWQGDGNGFVVYLNRANACKILGYKKETKLVKKEIQKEPEYKEVEEEVQIPITDCDVKNGKFSKEDIEVPA